MELRHVLFAVFRFAAATYNEIRKIISNIIVVDGEKMKKINKWNDNNNDK